MQALGIIGTTGSGKTALTLRLAQDHPTTILSADSRQVYSGLDITTGKDHPKDQKMHGIDQVDPNQEYSVSHWLSAATSAIVEAQSSNSQLIVVGGTGLYFSALVTDFSTLNIPPNESLRQSLSQASLQDLKKILASLDPAKYHSLNHSDQNNPRRLIRAIEVAKSESHHNTPSSPLLPDLPLYCLYYQDLAFHRQIITKRVLSRLAEGSLQETRSLLSRYSPALPAFSSVGYPPQISYLNQQISYDEMVTNWVEEELKYVKKQLTYFKKLKNLTWFDRGTMTLEEIYEQHLFCRNYP